MEDREKTIADRKAIYERWPNEYALGARQGIAKDETYPAEFMFPWTVEQRNAWFAGYCAGWEKRKAQSD